MTIEGIQVVHALPGRVRLKVAKVKGDPEFARKAQEKFAAVPGIQKVEANPITGSLLILYDLAAPLAAETIEPLGAIFGEFFPEIEALSLVSGLAALAGNPESGSNPGGGFTGAITAINTGIGKATGGLDLKLLVPLTLLFFGVRGLLAAEKTTFPAWHDYFWFAFSSLIMLNRGWFEGGQPEIAPIPVAQGATGGDLKEEAAAG
jgi:hypothetical protein